MNNKVKFALLFLVEQKLYNTHAQTAYAYSYCPYMQISQCIYAAWECASHNYISPNSGKDSWL